MILQSVSWNALKNKIDLIIKLGAQIDLQALIEIIHFDVSRGKNLYLHILSVVMEIYISELQNYIFDKMFWTTSVGQIDITCT